MAVTWNPDAGVQRTGNSGYSVLPENVIILPELSGRMDATDITELAADIKANKQLEPAVCWKDENGWPVLAAGHRRYRAIVKINQDNPENLEKIRLIFNYIPARNQQEAFDYTVRENRNRVNPSPLDDAHNIHVYSTRFGLGYEDIARKYYPSVSTQEEIDKAVAWVKETQKLLELSDTAKEELRKGSFSTSAAFQLAQIPSKKVQDDTIEEAKKSGKKLKVNDAKAARAKATGKKFKIADSSPAKLIPKFKSLAEVAGALAAEVLSDDPNPEAYMDLARTTLVNCRRLGIPLLPGFDKKADEIGKQPNYSKEAELAVA